MRTEWYGADFYRPEPVTRQMFGDNGIVCKESFNLNLYDWLTPARAALVSMQLNIRQLAGTVRVSYLNRQT